MKATQALHDLGQSLWLDNITRELLTSGTLKKYIDELSVTGLTSNPTIFEHAIKNSSAYDGAIKKLLQAGKSGENLFFEIALEDITQAADLFRSRSRRSLRATRRRRSASRRISSLARGAPTSTSRSRARRKDCRRSRKRSSPACRSTSRCSSRASNISRRPRRICAASSDASRRD
jgi:hypothetical protein